EPFHSPVCLCTSSSHDAISCCKLWCSHRLLNLVFISIRQLYNFPGHIKCINIMDLIQIDQQRWASCNWSAFDRLGSLCDCLMNNSVFDITTGSLCLWMCFSQGSSKQGCLQLEIRSSSYRMTDIPVLK
ncbi:hypothetical protein BVRB_031320, partial [Beta vulgaris subsp. vulgaris]